MQGADVQVKVEVRRGAAASFGRGITQTMPFQQFLRRFAAGDSSMYMTAQVSPTAWHSPEAVKSVKSASMAPVHMQV